MGNYYFLSEPEPSPRGKSHNSTVHGFLYRYATHSYSICYLLWFTSIWHSPVLFTVAVTGFTLNVGAYNAAYMTTAYNALNKYETEAAVVQGLNKRQVFLWIILPQVLLSSIPALTNQVINNLKDSTIVFLIQYTEFFARIQEVAATSFKFFHAYLFAAIVYLIGVTFIVGLTRF